MKSPEEKAKELIDSYKNLVSGDFSIEKYLSQCICATKAVSLLIDHLINTEVCFTDHVIPTGNYKYWNDVKICIEKLSEQ